MLCFYANVLIKCETRNPNKCTTFDILITDFLRFFANFAMLFTKSGESMIVTDIAINTTIAHVQKYAFKENWKSTAGCARAQSLT